MARRARHKKRAATEKPPPAEQHPKLQSSITELQEFQRGYGEQWLGIVKSPAFQTAMGLLNAQKNQFIETLTDEQIEKHGNIILADLRGHLNHEHDLATLHEKKEFTLPFEEEEIRLPPEMVVELEQKRAEMQERLRRQHYNA